ncbi:uncharacterized protein [Rhodnius prolixus]|uniref:uncharacterized protein n=1 Tax=Rhodnius prolixus TaxID=13249 RepID=UPI003D189F67
MSNDLLKKLNHPTSELYKKLDDLEVNKPYLIASFTKFEKTKYGPAILATIHDKSDTLSSVFLPKRFVNSFDDEDIFDYKDGDLVLIYKGIQNNMNVIQFESSHQEVVEEQEEEEEEEEEPPKKKKPKKTRKTRINNNNEE